MEAPRQDHPRGAFTYYVLIPDPQGFRVLMQETAPHDEIWTLPFFVPAVPDFNLVEPINRHVWQTYRLSVATLRCLMALEDGQQIRRYYVMDNYTADWDTPDGMRWVSEQELPAMTLADDGQRAVLRAYFDWLHSDHSLRPAWMRRGWFREVSHWMVDLADRMSMTVTHPVVQYRSWSRSCIVRLETQTDTLYLKAVPSYFAYEPVITRVLTLRYPELLPDVRAVHVDKGWMLMRAFEGVMLSEANDFEAWQNVVRYYGEIQADLVTNTQSLIALGVPDRHLDYLASQIEGLLRVLPDALMPAEKQAFETYAPMLRNLCYALLDHHVPLSLTHGDLWAGNIVRKPNAMPRFLDWSDSTIAHPFFDIPFFLEAVDAMTFAGIPDARAQLRDTYLDVWRRYEPLDRLQQAYAIAEVLSPLHQALIYHVHILPNLEANTRWEMEHTLVQLLRRVLQRAEAYTALGRD